VRCGAHCPMENIQGFNRSHWMLPLGKCSHRIATAATISWLTILVKNTKH
jgi:hypothetical protein